MNKGFMNEFAIEVIELLEGIHYEGMLSKSIPSHSLKSTQDALLHNARKSL